MKLGNTHPKRELALRSWRKRNLRRIGLLKKKIICKNITNAERNELASLQAEAQRRISQKRILEYV
jgi:hypothetical protein